MRKHILFVVSDPALVARLKRMLRAMRGRWESSFVGTLGAAQCVLRDIGFDAVVADTNVPDGDGLVLLAELRSLHHARNTPVIMLTARRERRAKWRALRMGATDLIDKPVRAEELFARLHSAIRLKAQQDDLDGRHAAVEQMVAARTAQLEDSRLDMICRLGRMAEDRDEGTGHHAVRIGCYSRVIAGALRADRDLAELLLLATPLHDIGMIAMPEDLVVKQGPLDEHEWDVLREHCAIGADLLRDDGGSARCRLACSVASTSHGGNERPDALRSMAASVALTHHEWWDGSGYPGGLAGREIPLPSRITALADAYDALSFDRPYRPALSEAEVLQTIRDEVGGHYDPEVHEAFERAIPRLREIRTGLPDEVYVTSG
jgi:putative two-component system response regulator